MCLSGEELTTNLSITWDMHLGSFPFVIFFFLFSPSKFSGACISFFFFFFSFDSSF